MIELVSHTQVQQISKLAYLATESDGARARMGLVFAKDKNPRSIRALRYQRHMRDLDIVFKPSIRVAFPQAAFVDGANGSCDIVLRVPDGALSRYFHKQIVRHGVLGSALPGLIASANKPHETC